jgi:hypothetical protein
MTRSCPSPLGLVLIVALTASAQGAGPADPLLQLAPPDAGLTLAVEDLSSHARTLLALPLVEGVRRLPVVKKWQESDDVRKLREAAGQVEAMLGADLPTLRDGLVGQAVVLTLRLPPGAAPDAARGMLLARVPDRALLDRLVAGLNAAQSKDGALRKVLPRQRAGVVYHVRQFAPGTRPDEFYAVLDGGLLAWSNSEELIHGAIDRKTGNATGLADVAAFRDVRQKLPAGALVSLFLEPRFAERLLAASPRPANERDERLAGLVGRYLAAVRYAGAALTWNDGPVLHTEEAIDSSKLDPALKLWATRAEPADPKLLRVPTSALAVATARVDLLAIVDALHTLTPEADRPRFENLRVAIQGMLLGLDLGNDVLPRLGPGIALYYERPDGPRQPLVVSVQVAATPEGARAAAAVDNTLRTFLALTAIDPKKPAAGQRVLTTNVGGATVTALESGATPYAYAVHDGRVVLGTSRDAVARALAAQADSDAGARFRQVRDRYCPGIESFACVDLRATHAFVDAHRPAFARRSAERQHRPVDEAARDLDQALALIDLFDSAYLTSTIDPTFSSVHRTLGLVARERSDEKQP